MRRLTPKRTSLHFLDGDRQLKHCEELTRNLSDSISRHRTDSILFSGGLDSAIIASLTRPEYAVTVGLGQEAEDILYSRQVAQKFCRRHVICVLDIAGIVGLIEKVIHFLKTFDPIAVRNSVVALAGLEQAKADGYSEVMTGDGGDELFAGYNYLSRYYGDHERLKAELLRLWQIMHFSTNDLAAAISMQVASPFLDPLFVSFAKSLPTEDKVGSRDGRQWGKFILRTCFESELGHIAWREKAAQEIGSGTWQISEYMKQSIHDSDWNQSVSAAAKEGVELRDKEHSYYYGIYRKYHSVPGQENANCYDRCPKCSGRFAGPNTKYCRICGAFPVLPVQSL